MKTPPPTCPECGSPVKTQRNRRYISTSGPIDSGWLAYCNRVTSCSTARSGIQGAGEKRPEAVASFLSKATS